MSKADNKQLEEKVERQTINAINYYKKIDNLEEVPVDILRCMYKDLLENSISKETLIERIRERQFELQQEYKDFKNDIRLNTLQDLLEEIEK